MFNFTSALRNFEYYWVGITDAQEEGMWKYTDGKLADDITLAWCNQEPDNYGNDEDCAYYHPCGMSDQNCRNAKYHALCQFRTGNCS